MSTLPARAYKSWARGAAMRGKLFAMTRKRTQRTRRRANPSGVAWLYAGDLAYPTRGVREYLVRKHERSDSDTIAHMRATDGGEIGISVYTAGSRDVVYVTGFSGRMKASGAIEWTVWSSDWNTVTGKRSVPSVLYGPGVADVVDRFGDTIDAMLEIHRRGTPPLEGGASYKLTDFPMPD